MMAATPPDAQTLPAPGQDQGQPAPRLKDVARGSALNLIGAGVAAVTTLALTVVITREYSKPVAGAFFTAISLFLIVESAAGLGAWVGLVNFIARLRRLGHEDRVPAILRAAVVPVVVVSLACTAGMLLFAEPLARLLLSGHLGKDGRRPGHGGGRAPGAGAGTPVRGPGRHPARRRPRVPGDEAHRGRGQDRPVQRPAHRGHDRGGGGQRGAARAAVGGTLRAGRRPRLVLAAPRPARATGREPGPPASPARPRARGNAVSVGAGVGSATSRGFWRFTGPRAVANLAQITIQRIDIVLVAIMRGPVEAAIYTAATRFLVAGQFANSALSQAAQPRFAELFAVDDRRGANVVYRATTAWLVMLTWPLYLLAVIYGPEILSIFGHSYRAGDMVMVILGLTMLVATACGQVDMVLITTGRSSWSLANGLMAVGVNVGLDVLLIPRYGITGAAIGWSAAIIITNLVPLAQLAASKRLNPFGRGTFIAIGLAVVSFAVIPLAARAAFGRGAAASLSAVAAGCLVQAAGLWRFRASLRLAALPGGVPPDQDLPAARQNPGRPAAGG